ncbi:hypothetical protein [Nostoc sp.]|uniref:hypothetical protein n=1 Tax=Nostoc sp. TaxID=1180 RepID=UPI002FF74D29
MQPRQGIVEIFSTFVQFDINQFSGWATDAKLRRSIKVCLESSSSEQLDTFWAIYWYRVWQTESSAVAIAHLSAYLQPTFRTSFCSIKPLHKFALIRINKNTQKL